MQLDQAIMYAERIVKQRIESTALYDVRQDDEVSELLPDEQQQILKLVHERIEPRAVAQTVRGRADR